MNIVLGIDVGGSTTKVVGFSSDDNLVGTLQVKADDQITSMYGAIGNFLRRFNISLKSVTKIILTGVGASLISDNVYNIPTIKVDEFQAIGLGGAKLSHLEQALVVSMGTGSAYVRVSNNQVTHIGGSGIGGGTLLGLSSKLINESDIAVIVSIAEKGNLSNVDLLVEDISDKVMPSLPSHATASNFGKIKNIASNADMALGLINIILQTVGILAAFACKDSPIKDIVLIGSLSVLPQAKGIFDELSRLHQVNFIIPDHSVFATAIGATVPYLHTSEG
jgi:type II pantothenate kinase